MPVDEQQGQEKSELRDGEVAAVNGLRALLPPNSDSQLCLLDHANVVGAVADGQRNGPGLDPATKGAVVEEEMFVSLEKQSN